MNKESPHITYPISMYHIFLANKYPNICYMSYLYICVYVRITISLHHTDVNISQNESTSNGKTKIFLWNIKKSTYVSRFSNFFCITFLFQLKAKFFTFNGKEVEHLCLQCIKFSKEKVATKRWEKFGSKLGIVLYIFCCCVFALSINCLRFLKEKPGNFNSKLLMQICFRLR